MASAQELPQIPGSSQSDIERHRTNFNNGVLNARDGIIRDTRNLPREVRTPLHQGVDNAVNAIAPGALAAREAARKPAPAPKPAPKPAPRPSSPCPPSARACVDLANNTTWLQQNGRITYGPVGMSHGRPGQETPRGTFTVQYQVKDEISREFNNAPMPYATYFTLNGHAFHQGTTNVQSAGCVRMNRADAQHYFYNLNPGDQVYIW